MALEFHLRDLIQPPRKILKEIGIGPGMSVLDFGCGPGSFSLAASHLVGPEGLVYALDINPIAVEFVKKVVARKSIKNIQTILGSGTDEIPEKSMIPAPFSP